MIIAVDLPSKIVYDVEVMGFLPCGLIYKEESLSVSGAKSLPVAVITGSNDGEEETTIVWRFKEIDNRNDGDLTIAFQAVLADVSKNRDSAVLSPIRASLRWKDSGGATYTSSDQSGEFHVVEPDLTLERSADASFAASGKTVTFTLSFYHSAESSSEAFDVDLKESLPKGLIYCQNTMEILSGPAGRMEVEDPFNLRWHFEAINSAWCETNKVVLRYRAIVAEGFAPEDLLSRASLIWSSAPGENPDEREYSAEADGSLDMEALQGMAIFLEDEPDPIAPGRVLNYTICFESLDKDAHGVVIKGTYDGNVSFLSASPSPDQGTDDCWTWGDLSLGEKGTISLKVRVNPSLHQDTELQSLVEIRSEEGLNASDICATSVKGKTSLFIENRASRDILTSGGVLNYTLTFGNDGDTTAANVTVSDIIDRNLEFHADRDAVPRPTRIWTDYQGTHLWWSAEALGTEALSPGESGRIEISSRLPLSAENPALDRVTNLYRIDSDSGLGELRSLETFVVRSLFVRKKADRDFCSEGGVLNYTIVYGNLLDVPAKNAVIIDLLPDVDYLTASPRPSYIKGSLLAWELPILSPKSNGSIALTVKIKERPEMNFLDWQSVSGQGKVFSRRSLSTKHQPSGLTNYVNITALYPDGEMHDQSYSDVNFKDASGIDIEAVLHGSGKFEEEQMINFSWRSISFDRHLSASVKNGTSRSRWADRVQARNGLRGEKISENSLYMKSMKKDSSLLLDWNQTVSSSQGDFLDGKMQISYIKRPSGRRNDSLEVYEDYHGSFAIKSHLDSYGQGAAYARQSAGQGFVSSDMRFSGGNAAQRSYEHGSGTYRLDELLATGPAIYKNVQMNYAASNQSAGSVHGAYASKWSEGEVSQNSEFGSKIGARTFYGDYIQKEALMDSSSLSMTGKFRGMGSIKAVREGSIASEQVEETLLGDFRLDVTLGISRMPNYLCPHLNLTKRVLGLEGKGVIFRINITNDGNKTLAPLEIIDHLPPGLSFVNSSIRPEVVGQNISWHLLSLPIGATQTIDLQAYWDKTHPSVVNNAEAVGYYGDQKVSARASCYFPCSSSPKTLSRISAMPSALKGEVWQPLPCMEIGAPDSNLSVCFPEDDYYIDDYQMDDYPMDDYYDHEAGTVACHCSP